MLTPLQPGGTWGISSPSFSVKPFEENTKTKISGCQALLSGAVVPTS